MPIDDKIVVKKLEIQQPPISSIGGRIFTPAGEIAQIMSGLLIKYIAYIEFNNDPELRRGNHYHKDKEEFLYIIKGKLKAIYKDLDTETIKELILETGDLIYIKPRCAHVYVPLEYTQAIEFSPFEYDPKDTHKHFLE